MDLESPYILKWIKWWIQKYSFVLQNNQVVDLGLEQWTSGESKVALEFQNGQVVDLESLLNLEWTSGGSRNPLSDLEWTSGGSRICRFYSRRTKRQIFQNRQVVDLESLLNSRTLENLDIFIWDSRMDKWWILSPPLILEWTSCGSRNLPFVLQNGAYSGGS